MLRLFFLFTSYSYQFLLRKRFKIKKRFRRLRYNFRAGNGLQRFKKSVTKLKKKIRRLSYNTTHRTISVLAKKLGSTTPNFFNKFQATEPFNKGAMSSRLRYYHRVFALKSLVTLKNNYIKDNHFFYTSLSRSVSRKNNIKLNRRYFSRSKNVFLKKKPWYYPTKEVLKSLRLLTKEYIKLQQQQDS